VEDSYESNASTIVKFEVGGNANHLKLTSSVTQGMRSLDNSCLFSGDNDDVLFL
jgi:hypothetical protein